MSLDLGFDDTQLAIFEGVDQFCRDRCGPEVVKAAAAHFPSGLWRDLAELGVFAAATPEGEGGALEIAAVMEALGRAVFPGPLAATFLATQLLPEAERVAVASGTSLVSLGSRGLMPWAPLAQLFLEVEGERVWRVQPRQALQSVATLGGEPWGRGELERQAELGEARRGLSLYDIALAAYLAAAAQRLVEEASEHARTRTQFGRAIGEFQAVAHPLANCSIRQAAAATLARTAAFHFDRGDAEARGMAAAARLSACAAAVDAAHVCHQVFGAIGITLEGPAFHVTRRIRQLASQPPRPEAARAAVFELFDCEEGSA
ncbi:MAG: acyl-CoA dehydrogenase family protein [Myxococcota bacterium]